MSNHQVSIEFAGENITVNYVVKTRNEGNGVYSSYMPGFDMYFTSNSQEDSLVKAESMLNHFFDFWIKDQNWKSFVLQMHKLGFRAPLHNMEMQNLLKNRPTTTNFQNNKSLDSDNVFSSMESIKQEAQLVA